jgi:hypothetical protein
MKKRTTFAQRLPLGEEREGHEGKRVAESYCVSPKINGEELKTTCTDFTNSSQL